LNSIKLEHLRYDQGITRLGACAIDINTHLIEDTIGMRFVVYHELGHWFGLDHSDGIMQKSYNTKDDQLWVRENWRELLNKHFARIKRLQEARIYRRRYS
jgi:Zn-dependent peptidase ImmA (M78 family)